MQVAAVAAAAEAEPVDPQAAALVDGAKAALGALAFVALGVSSQGSHDFTEMLTILTLVRVCRMWFGSLADDMLQSRRASHAHSESFLFW